MSVEQIHERLYSLRIFISKCSDSYLQAITRSDIRYYEAKLRVALEKGEA